MAPTPPENRDRREDPARQCTQRPSSARAAQNSNMLWRRAAASLVLLSLLWQQVIFKHTAGFAIGGNGSLSQEPIQNFD